jgi:hypothetical protein
VATRAPAVVYPGATVISCSYTLSHGTRPGVVELVCFPQLESLARTGNVVITDAVNGLVIRNCRVVGAKASMSVTAGLTVTVILEDGRCLWRYGTINGHWNIPIPRVFDTPRVAAFNAPAVNQAVAQLAGQSDQFKPPIQEWSRKSARALAELLLQAMGVTSYDVRAIPDDQFIETFWDAATASVELDRLAEFYGCRVSFNPETLHVALVRLGSGQLLPEAPGDELQQDGLGVNPPVPPGRISVYGSPTVWQVRFALEAVGLDFDGQYKPLDQLSYVPPDGWEHHGPPFHQLSATDFYPVGQLPGTRTAREAMALAQESVWRCYRITATTPWTGEFVFPPGDDFGDTVERHHIVLLDHLPEGTYDDLGQRTLMPPRVTGRAFRYDQLNFRNTDVGEVVLGTFGIDPVHRLIRFDSPVLLYEAQGVETEAHWHPAEIYLDAACFLLDPDTHQPQRFRMDYPVAGGGAHEHAVVRDEIRYFHVSDYTTTNEVNTVTTNRPEAEAKAQFFFTGELLRFQTPTPQERIYNGLKRIFTDGAVWQVTVNASQAGITTHASRNNEHSVFVPPYDVRRQAEIGTTGPPSRFRQKVDFGGFSRPDGHYA